ncbi:MAG: 4-(cytidine 5'-diphospho)-2-C-methyl-D-erythritol kinase, partial [Rhizobacter sp.]|nr:4-(cytidine 5'-diphospho)-2-C-methyl-D-erythritol kinase [Chlorobiales bacterium]
MTKILKAYAKINLALFITAKRADGYHDLETVF